jgi:hypothetical protein
MAQPALRWTVAAGVTIAAFTAATWTSGALVLPALKMHDPAIRWGIAGALGVAVAALAALWGHFYATGEPTPRQLESQPSDALHSLPPPASSAPGRGDTHNTISGGTFQRPVIQGRDIGPVDLAQSQPASPPSQANQATPPAAPAPGSGDTHTTISDGTFRGPVSQGRDYSPPTRTTPPTDTDPAAPNNRAPGHE